MWDSTMLMRILTTVYWVTMIAFPVHACVGTRPMGMGNAFIGVADDAYATYWNPAGLAFFIRPELTYTGIVYERNKSGYDDYISIAYPINWGTLGLSFMHDSWSGIQASGKTYWWILSYGRKISESLALGLNIRPKSKEVKEGSSIDDSNYTSVDLALLWKWKRFSFGFLLQNINKPSFTLLGRKTEYFMNVRPGVAFRPTKDILLSAEIYDLTASGQPEATFRVGGEYILDRVALRGGVRRLNTDLREITGGIGYEIINGDKNALTVDYAIMHQLVNNKTTHFLGLKIKL